MSTDDSISEDVSSSVALSHDQISANGGKESEASGVSSEDTVSGLAVPEEDRSGALQVRALEGFLQVAEGAELTHPLDIPARNISHKLRNLCLRTEEEFGSGRNLPFINPSSLETLRALVQEIQSSGETDPEVWKNCEGRWLQLFQLVEKQYQEQILAQQEQYQCQIQLIQDEIKALVQLQNRPNPTKAEPPGHVTNDSQRCVPGAGPTSSTVDPQENSDEGPVTVLSSGYGTLSAWEPTPEPGPPHVAEGRGGAPWLARQQGSSLARSPLAETSLQVRDAVLNISAPPTGTPQATASAVTSPPADEQRLNSQLLTSWAQRQKHRQKRTKVAQKRSPPTKRREDCRPDSSPKEHMASMDEPGCTGVYSKPVALKRSDSLVSEASGLTYWKLEESELYHPLPDSFESLSFFLMQEVSVNQPLADEARLSLSLKEIYQRKQKGDPKGQEWDSLITSDASSLQQVLPLDPTVPARPSERTSGFTSPSRFSSPSLTGRSRLCPAAGVGPVSPDSVAALPSGTDTDCVSNASSLSTQPGLERSPVSPIPCAPPTQLGNSEDEGSHTASVTLRPARLPRRERRPSGRGPDASTSLDDPVVLSLLRQNLREKHARHIADVRAYYEAEISTLREKLDLASLPLDVEKSNQILLERCEHLERALTEASVRIQELENRNRHLERQLADWPERYAAAGSAVRALQLHLKESERSGREKEAAVSRLRSRMRQLEQAAQSACRDALEKDAHAKKEHKMLQDLLQEYDSLRKDHEGVKDNLVVTENKLFDANEEISDLKRIISKLEAQVKQLEHENMAKTRQAPKSHTQPSGAGLFHHPDLLLSPGQRQRDLESSRKSTGLPNKTAIHSEGRVSPPERERAQEQTARRDVPLAPVMKALIQMEDTKATEGRALAKSARLGRRRPTVAFVDNIRESFLEQGASVLRPQRSLSPEGHRSSSLPPRTQRAGLPSTPTKRETLIQPLSAKSSPKRCPTENVSTAFGRPLPCQQHLHTRFSWHLDKRGSSAGARLRFTPTEGSEANAQSGMGWAEPTGSSDVEELTMPPGQEEQTAADASLLPHDPGDEASLSYHSRVRSLADAERLFDELTQEKQQIEAALSRIPAAGARASLQTKLDEVTLENRLEKVNRDLGHIRMTLKRFNILRSSVNI
ncbi:M-phase phosphoprotein 9 isoform X1 [Electrophorus electricus]|uniref:M-phase phosphoprotein 9 isoform X1 n=1 Tax=Electrophorus electricus TaxID=8005 RepID=UPI0015CFAC23|nr:M-phase phosphoprotein 9 isoform X1 [Electrophorus electricus]